MSLLADVDDADLVARSVAGSREAFGQIVARYQGPVCAVAYSATGSLALSEDIAQETFLVAWRRLGELREVTRLRSWLCGIARIQAASVRRREKREPSRTGDSIEGAIDVASRDPLPPDQAISREEQAILWSTLERIPASYREPLVLFYREHQSVESVAQALDLSEDVVRQRLTRGRKLLHERMLAVVEGALGRTAPGEAFTLGVVATLPASTAGAGLASVGTAASKGGAVAKSAMLGSLFVALAGPLTGAFGVWLSARGNLEAARTARERALARRQTVTLVAGAVTFSFGVAGLTAPLRFWAAHVAGLVTSTVVLVLAYAAWMAMLLVRATSEQRRVREEERRLHPEAFANEARATLGRKSATTFLGLPLWHVRLEVAPVGAGPVVAWIAVGDHAIGALAIGGSAVGLLGFGGLAVGVVSFGGASFGLLTLGGVAAGVFAIGSIAAGLVALGGVAFGWNGAAGAVALGRDYAGGALALAPHANDAAAAAFFARIHAGTLFRSTLFSLFVLTALALLWSFRRSRRRSRLSSSE